MQTQETLKRWRLILGGDDADGTGVSLSGEESAMDKALAALYEFERKGRFEYTEKSNENVGRGASQPSVARWLGDIRNFFPQSVVQVMQHDALQKDELKKKLLFEPEILEQTTADVHLVATLMELGK